MQSLTDGKGIRKWSCYYCHRLARAPPLGCGSHALSDVTCLAHPSFQPKQAPARMSAGLRLNGALHLRRVWRLSSLSGMLLASLGPPYSLLTAKGYRLRGSGFLSWDAVPCCETLLLGIVFLSILLCPARRETAAGPALLHWPRPSPITRGDAMAKSTASKPNRED